jgi:hypothetical protein
MKLVSLLLGIQGMPQSPRFLMGKLTGIRHSVNVDSRRGIGLLGRRRRSLVVEGFHHVFGVLQTEIEDEANQLDLVDLLVGKPSRDLPQDLVANPQGQKEIGSLLSRIGENLVPLTSASEIHVDRSHICFQVVVDPLVKTSVDVDHLSMAVLQLLDALRLRADLILRIVVHVGHQLTSTIQRDDFLAKRLVLDRQLLHTRQQNLRAHLRFPFKRRYF